MRRDDSGALAQPASTDVSVDEALPVTMFNQCFIDRSESPYGVLVRVARKEGPDLAGTHV